MILAIADLHLDITKEKDMSIFGGNWENYEKKIFSNWNNHVSIDDLVLIPGDISWAMKLEDAYFDLKRIDELNGKKIILRGNHDYWWNSLKKINDLELETIDFLQNNAFIHKNILIVGSRAWDSRDTVGFNENDERVFLRELQRLELSIKYGLKNFNDFDEIIAMLHYPPFNRDNSPNEFEKIFKKYNIKTVVYGHLHGVATNSAPEGEINDIKYICVSGDKINFVPVKIKEV